MTPNTAATCSAGDVFRVPVASVSQARRRYGSISLARNVMHALAATLRR
jgi:hypothetical protein